MTISPYDSVLGISNFRQEWTGAVNDLTNILPINPTIEKLDDANTYNTRFQQLSQAMRHSFNAAADIAIRDKKYLEAFLAGYTNPIVIETDSYKQPEIYTNVPSFNVNGNPITFTDARVMYNVSTLGILNVTSVQIWVFKNGELLDDAGYTILNTAYGVKCFVKATLIQPKDEVSIVVNRIYNTSNDYYTKVNITKSVTTASYIFPVTNFGVFYHIDYLKVMVKRANKWITIPEINIVKELDVTGQNVKIRIVNFNLLNADVLYVFNSIYRYETKVTKNVTTANPWVKEFPLTETKNSELLPVPFLSSFDFDIFLNGRQLIPEYHYTVTEPDFTTDGVPKIVWMFTVPSNQTAVLKIFKNEAVPKNNSNYIFEKLINTKGIVAHELFDDKLPFMPTLGHCFVSGKRVPNERIKAIQRSIIKLDGLDSLKEMFYQTRIVYTFDIAAVVEYCKGNLNEYDQVLRALGRNAVINNIKAQYEFDDASQLNNTGTTVETANPDYTFTYSDKVYIDSKSIATLVDSIIASGGDPLIIDSNTLLTNPKNDVMSDIIIGDLVIDANVFTPTAVIFRAN